MGMYDFVYIPCPECGEVIKEQSKGGSCELKHYTYPDVPCDVMGYLIDSIIICPTCLCSFKIKVRYRREIQPDNCIFFGIS